MTAHGATADPYRVVFEHLSVGAARCRLRVEHGYVVDAEIVDSNAAFADFRDVVPELFPMFTRIHERGRPEKLALQTWGLVLSVSAYPAGGGEVVVLIEDVTAREELEERSRRSQDRFVTAFQGNAAAMVIAHPSDLRILDVNPRWLEMFGATRDDVIGRTSVELGLISEEDAEARIAEHKVFAGGYDIELALRTRAGKRLTVLASARPIEIAEGTYTLTTLIDITGRKHAEEAFAVAFNSSPAGMILVRSASDTVVAVNSRLLEMTGHERDTLVGRAVSELALVREPTRVDLLAEVRRSGRLEAVEVELQRADGGGTWTLASTETISMHDSEHRLSVFTDITARKRVERRLLTQHEIGRILAEASVLESALPQVLAALCRDEGWDAGAVWLPADDDLGALVCRAMWQPSDPTGELAEIGRAIVPGGNPGMLARVLATGAAEKVTIGPEHGDHAAAVLAAGIRSALAFPILRGSEVLGVAALGARHDAGPLDVAERGLLDSVGHLLGSFVARARAEASLRELNSELERRVLERTQALASTNRDLEAFSSSVSHDLRAPLRTIQGFSQMLLEDFVAVLPEQAQKLLVRIDASGKRLGDLIDDVLAFARLGREGLRRATAELDPMVRSVVDELLAGRDLGDRLDLRILPLGSCYADPILLRSVWTNLIDNALKYTRGRDRIEIEIGVEARGDELVYYVRDNGVGFDPRYADRLFGLFERLHSATEFEGTGVGLANVRRVVERHHGRVAATSELGRGSRFEFTLGTAPG